MMDINTVSAGGGTISKVDRFGALEVGPESAGAVPGPACYSRGGTVPAITDCNLVLGYLSVDNFLGGKMRLDAGAARKAVESVAKPLNMSTEDTAEGIIRIIDVKMAEAIKAISTMRGHDLRDFMLLAFGGAGPVHACRIARDLGMAGVIVPLYPGVYSAIGLVMSDVKHDYIQSRMTALSEIAPKDLSHMFDQLSSQALEDLRADGFSGGNIRVQRSLDMRYAGQGYEITIPCEPEMMTAEGLQELRKSFDEVHRGMFGHMAPEEPVEIVSYRVRGVGKVPAVEMPRFERAGTTLKDALRETRKVRFDGKTVDCPIYQREKLDVGLTFSGPAVLDQFDCTTVICPGQTVRVDEWKNLIVTQER
jgi:N-methylhydantoinase A